MGTRSMIDMVMDDGKIKGIYCHWDGYEDHNGKILVKHYTTEEKVESLLNLGDISSLSESIECPEGHSYNVRMGQKGTALWKEAAIAGGLVLMKTKIIKCSCKNNYQDIEYGAGMRVHNIMKTGAYRCTVCSRETGVLEKVKITLKNDGE